MLLDRLVTRWRSADSWERVAWTAWTVALIAVCVRCAGWPHSHSVYPIFERSAYRWMDGRDLYAFGSEGEPGAAHDLYRYSPLVAALFVPFSLLPDSLANLLWRLINAGVLLGGLAWCCRAILPKDWGRPRHALLFLAALPLSVDALNNGQSNVLVIGLALISLAALSSQRWTLAAVCGALMFLFKAYPLAVCLLLLLFYPRRFGPRLVLAMAAGLLLPYLLQRPEYVTSQYTSWLHHMGANDRHIMPTDLWYRDFRLLCSLAGKEMSYLSYQMIEAGLGAGIALFCLAGRQSGWPERALLIQVLGLGSCWMTVFGPATESSTYSLLAPIAGLLIVEAGRPGRRRLRPLIATAYVLLMAPHLCSWFPGNKALFVQGMQPLGGLLILAALLALGLRGMRRTNLTGLAYPLRPRET